MSIMSLTQNNSKWNLKALNTACDSVRSFGSIYPEQHTFDMEAGYRETTERRLRC